MRALFYIDILKNYRIQRPIVLVDKSAENISSLMNRTYEQQCVWLRKAYSIAHV